MSSQQEILLWLDDVRFPPTNKWVWVQTAADAIQQLRSGQVLYASLDHDLAPCHYPWASDYNESQVRTTSGEAVTKYLLREYFVGDKAAIPTMGVRVHSMNVVGSAKMVQSIETIYDENFQCDARYEILPWPLYGQPNGFCQRNATTGMIERYRNARHSA